MEEQLNDGRRVLQGPATDNNGWLRLTYSSADEKMVMEITGRRTNPANFVAMGVSRQMWAAPATSSARRQAREQRVLPDERVSRPGSLVSLL